MDTKLRKVVTDSETLPSLKPHDLLITWHLKISKIYISTITRVIVSTPDRMLTYTQTIKLSSTSGLFLYYHIFLYTCFYIYIEQ